MILCWFLPHIIVNQPQVYLHPLPHEPPSHLPPPTPSHPSRLLQSPHLSSLSHTANSHWLSILHTIVYMLGVPGGTSGKCRRHKRCGFDSWAGKIPWRRAWQPTPVCLPAESHGQRSLEGYRPQCCKESDTSSPWTHAVYIFSRFSLHLSHPLLPPLPCP